MIKAIFILGCLVYFWLRNLLSKPVEEINDRIEEIINSLRSKKP